MTLGLLVFYALSSDQEVLIESHESKTATGNPVYNKIKRLRRGDTEIWLMNQSHHGIAAPAEKWDRLAIVIDHSQEPKSARFYQFEPGPLEWTSNMKERPFRMSCFTCHNNGPRAIRPEKGTVSWRDQLQISMWNLRIKLYGRIIPDPMHLRDDTSRGMPFRLQGPMENQTLKIKTCAKCHKEEGWLARGALHLQQFSTIRHLVESGQMPPPGFALSSEEEHQLVLFLQGLAD